MTPQMDLRISGSVAAFAALALMRCTNSVYWWWMPARAVAVAWLVTIVVGSIVGLILHSSATMLFCERIRYARGLGGVPLTRRLTQDETFDEVFPE